MAGLGAKDILRNITALEQLIEEINFQRAKEMRQCLMSKDSDTGFVMVHGTTYWTDLFVRHFLFQTDRSTDADDLLFFIRKKQMKGSRYIPKYQTEVEVYRKDSRKLPIGDPDIDWEETVYLNLIIHQFDYTLTLAVCTRTSPKELQVLRRHSQKVYASPSRRRMDTKGEVEEITYPNVCFHVDNFDEVFADMLVRDGEMVCVELVASDHAGTRQAVIFLGSIRYDALKRVYDARASLSSKVAQRMMMGLFSGNNSQRIEFVRMKGPQGKGHAEMAVTKPKGSGVETPTSEPGLSLTDLWDPDWEDEPEDRFFYAHQRRLSDPSANFNTFINSGWVSRAEGRSRSENEGLDNFANGLYEIESGDVRDATSSCRCCSVVACRRYDDEESGNEFSKGMCDKCEHFHGNQQLLNDSSDLGNSHHEIAQMAEYVSPVKAFHHEPSALLQKLSSSEDDQCYRDKGSTSDEFEVVEAMEASEDMDIVMCNDCLSSKPSVKGNTLGITGQYDKLEGGCKKSSDFNSTDQSKSHDWDVVHSSDINDSNSPSSDFNDYNSPNEFELETLNTDKVNSPEQIVTNFIEQDRPISPDEADPFLDSEVCEAQCETNLKRKESLNLQMSKDILSEPWKHSKLINMFSLKKKKLSPGSAVRVCPTGENGNSLCPSTSYVALATTETNDPDGEIVTMATNDPLQHSQTSDLTADENTKHPIDTGQSFGKTKLKRAYSSGPMYYRRLSLDIRKHEKSLLRGEAEKLTKSKSWESVRGSNLKKGFKRQASIPFRVTKDGTKVYFLCDIKLDDGAYNPLWTTKGFTQTFHFWKESRRAQSVPLNAYLTYVTLPWFTIITDILDHRTGPILTF